MNRRTTLDAGGSNVAGTPPAGKTATKKPSRLCVRAATTCTPFAVADCCRPARPMAPEPPMTGAETAAASRRLVASLRGMGAMVPRPGHPGWVDPIDPCDLGPLSDERGAA